MYHNFVILRRMIIVVVLTEWLWIIITNLKTENWLFFPHSVTVSEWVGGHRCSGGGCLTEPLTHRTLPPPSPRLLRWLVRDIWPCSSSRLASSIGVKCTWFKSVGKTRWRVMTAWVCNWYKFWYVWFFFLWWNWRMYRKTRPSRPTMRPWAY